MNSSRILSAALWFPLAAAPFAHAAENASQYQLEAQDATAKTEQEKADQVKAAKAKAKAAKAKAEADAAAEKIRLEPSPNLENSLVRVTVDKKAATFAITDAKTGEILIGATALGTTFPLGGRVSVESRENITDELGKGCRITLLFHDMSQGRNTLHYAHCNYPAKRLVTLTLYENSPALILGFGLEAPVYYSKRVMNATPLDGAKFLPGKKLENPLTLNGGAGNDGTFVLPGPNRRCANSLLLTGLVDGKRRSVVFGGLANGDFGKFVEVKDGVLTAWAEDPVGRLVPTGTSYIAPDTVYVDAFTSDPFKALEAYGLAMRAVTHAKPNVYDFPVLCGWSVGAISKLPDVNNSAKLVEQVEAGNKLGIGKYTKIGVRLEPDSGEEQGWWDDAHWVERKHLVEPYTTVASWCKALSGINGVPYIYAQSGMPAKAFCKAHPDWMLYNDISELSKKIPGHNQPYVTYDYTDKGLSEHIVNTWKRLRNEGVVGVKFDYPETAWRPEGGFDDRYATTTSAYRRCFSLVREGFGPDRLIDERNLGEGGRPMLDVTAGIVDTQRCWGDSNQFVPEMASRPGLRWYKNRTVFNYFPDTKSIHDHSPEVRRSMMTLMFLTSGRFDMATSYSLFTPEMAHDFTRAFPHYQEPKTARPLDAFTGVRDPQVYDLALTPDWHQIALFNTGTAAAVIGTSLAGEPVDNAIGLDPNGKYHAYEFWSDTYLGELDGKARLEKKLEPMNSVMVSLRKKQTNPQVLSTNRHLLQGHVDLADVKWDAATKTLSGVAKVIGGEPFKIVVAGNGAKAAKSSASGAEATLAAHSSAGLSVLTLTRADNGDVAWRVTFE